MNSDSDLTLVTDLVLLGVLKMKGVRYEKRTRCIEEGRQMAKFYYKDTAELQEIIQAFQERKSDTPRRAGGLMSWAASKAVVRLIQTSR